MPQKSTRSSVPGGGRTSGIVRFLAASRSAGLGRVVTGVKHAPRTLSS
jgi:hypothetical protein